jgi:tetratricopeptide (TPR) repeat protein
VYRLGRHEEAAELARRRVKVARAAFGDRHPMTASALRDLASVEQDLGRFDLAREHYDTAIGVMLDSGDEQVIQALRMRALFRRGQGDAAGALSDFDAGLVQCRKYKPDHAICQVLRANRAGQLARMGRGEEALGESDAVLAEFARMEGVDDNEYAQALEARAFALDAVGRGDEARATQEQAIARYAAIFGAGHVEVERARANLARLGLPATRE